MNATGHDTSKAAGAPRSVATFGPCARCGRIASHLVYTARAVAVVHRDESAPCPVHPGEMPELAAGDHGRPSSG